MLRLALVSLALLLLAPSGCSNPFGCDDRTQVIDIEYDAYGPGTEDLNTLALKWALEGGWTCEESPLRNGAGEVIGERHVCTICD